MKKHILHFFEQSWLVIVASFCFGLLLAITNAAWSPQIEQNRIDRLNRLRTELFPNAEKFEPAEKLKLTSPRGSTYETEVFKVIQNDQLLGWTFIAVGPGFADVIELVVGVTADFEKYTGFAVLASNETPGFGDKIAENEYKDQFIGAPVTTLELAKFGDRESIDSTIIAITGATVSSNAAVEIVNNAIPQVKEQLQEKGLLQNGQ